MPICGPALEKLIALKQILERGLRANPEGPALVSTASRWSWRELDPASRHVPVNLLGLGLRPGDRVASLMPDRTALFVHYRAWDPRSRPLPGNALLGRLCLPWLADARQSLASNPL